MKRRAFVVPEVVQTSAMDCGPAALKALLEGHGIRVSYGRLREACQTSVDGTSIGALDQLANQLGLVAEEVMLPADQLFADASRALPAIVVTNLPNGLTHFILVWRRHGRFIQVMDPAIGRRWVRADKLLEEIYLHTATVPASDWRDYAATDEFCGPLRAQLAACGLGEAEALLARGLADPSWRTLAQLDALARLGRGLREAAGLRGEKLGALLRSFLEGGAAIPEECWQVREAPPGEDGGEQVRVRGAVLVRVTGQKDAAAQRAAREELSLELRAALDEAPLHPAAQLWRLLQQGGLGSPLLLGVTLPLLAGCAIVEALLLRGLFDVGRELGLAPHRWAALGALAAFLALLAALEVPVLGSTQRIARQLEVRLRLLLLEKIPRLGDRYLTSRPISDMAERSHNAHQLRALPEQARRLLRAVLEVLATALGLAWLDPKSAPLALLAAGLAVLVPILLQRQLNERDHRARVHSGALTRFNLDALLGLTAVRAHGAERALRREQESLLVEWVGASRALLRTVTLTEALQLLFGLVTTSALVLFYLPRAGEGGGILLFTYWAMNLSSLGQEIAAVLRQAPTQRNLALRLLEPLGALEEEEAAPAPAGAAPLAARAAAASIELRAVSVRAGGHLILEQLDLKIAPGEQVAIVGASGAGKSSLAGLLLGWHRPAEGELLVDGRPLLGAAQDELRQEIAWLDPAQQLWNRSMLANLRYGSAPEAALPISRVLEQADLLRVLEGLPEGMQTPLGEGGGLLSGGEGQRVRLARALFREEARLVILDEPFRGLDRPRRRLLLERTRAQFTGATLLCITHDVAETQGFARVLVIEGGRIVEDGPPARLLESAGSRYAALLAAEESLRRDLFDGARFRKLEFADGALREEGAP